MLPEARRSRHGCQNGVRQRATSSVPGREDLGGDDTSVLTARPGEQATSSLSAAKDPARPGAARRSRGASLLSLLPAHRERGQELAGQTRRRDARATPLTGADRRSTISSQLLQIANRKSQIRY